MPEMPEMPETAEAVSATLATNCNCMVEITNISSSYCLIIPKMCIACGYSCHPPQPTVCTTKTKVCSFTNDAFLGTLGCLTYDLFEMRNHRYKNECLIHPVQMHLCGRHIGAGK
ncbi:hypothetical protein AAFF_G00052700 [Aldrovandia affinis]|uniref:Uncharacterized protein n=1 Tax=Aldrovandia affinis TaxID=143900 RepID=A0AAD7T535_9TELE|nr:hypothetical protein AAFF_G00052700 [Aldrovandia affinis]